MKKNFNPSPRGTATSRTPLLKDTALAGEHARHGGHVIAGLGNEVVDLRTVGAIGVLLEVDRTFLFQLLEQGGGLLRAGIGAEVELVDAALVAADDLDGAGGDEGLDLALGQFGDAAAGGSEGKGNEGQKFVEVHVSISAELTRRGRDVQTGYYDGSWPEEGVA